MKHLLPSLFQVTGGDGADHDIFLVLGQRKFKLVSYPTAEHAKQFVKELVEAAHERLLAAEQALKDEAERVKEAAEDFRERVMHADDAGRVPLPGEATGGAIASPAAAHPEAGSAEHALDAAPYASGDTLSSGAYQPSEAESVKGVDVTSVSIDSKPIDEAGLEALKAGVSESFGGLSKDSLVPLDHVTVAAPETPAPVAEAVFGADIANQLADLKPSPDADPQANAGPGLVPESAQIPVAPAAEVPAAVAEQAPEQAQASVEAPAAQAEQAQAPEATAEASKDVDAQAAAQ